MLLDEVNKTNRQTKLTLYFYNNEPSTNKHFLISLSRPTRYSQDPNWKEFLTSCESFLRFFLFFSLTGLDPGFGLTLGQFSVVFCKCYFHNTSKKVFWPKKYLNSMHRFKSATLPELKNCQNGTFEPAHGIQTFVWPKDFFWSIMKVPCPKNIHNISRFPFPLYIFAVYKDLD